MQRLVLLVLTALCLTAWAAAIFLFGSYTSDNGAPLPTLMVLPSVTPTDTPSPSAVPTETLVPSPTASLIPTESFTPTRTPTLAERLLEMVVVMPGVQIAPSATPFPAGLNLLQVPPQPVEPLPDATAAAPPFMGWYSFESDYPVITYQPAWTPRLAQAASRGQYHRTGMPRGSAFFSFEGEGMRIRYVAAQNMGLFDIVVDGVVIDTIDAYADALAFPATEVYVVGSGAHLLEIRATGRKNSRSEGAVVGLDAVHVFRSDAHTVIVPPRTVTTPTGTPRPAARIELISAPPTVQPTGTPVPPRVITAEVVIAYDENGNRTVDPAEGVSGISVRVVETNTNRVIASGFTDERGYAAFELVTGAPSQIVVPYFGKAWALQRGSSAAPAYTLLLTPGNQPGLIP